MARIRAILSSVSVLCIKSAPMLPQESNQILPLKRAEFQRQAARTHRLRIPNTQNQHLEIQRSNFATASGQESRRNWLARESVRTCVYGPRTKTNARGKEGWIVAFIIIWKGATIRGRVGPFLQILDERERGRNGFAIVRSFKVQPPGTPGARRFLFLTFLFRQPHLALLHFLFLLLRAALLLFPGRISILIFFHPFFFHVRTSVISSSSFFPSATPFPLRPTRPPPLTFVPLSCHPPKEVIFLDLACGLRSSVTKGVRRGKGRERDEFSCNFAASCFYALSPSLSRFYLLLLLLPQTSFIGRLTHLSWYAERVLSRLFLF